MAKADIRTQMKVVLSRYSRAIVHMRQQLDEKRFGLILGAGVSRAFGFPDWKQLVEGIAKHSEVNGSSLIEKASGNTSQSQLLFHHYRSNRLAKATADDHRLNRLEASILAGWHQVVHDVLYKAVPDSTDALLDRDQFLGAFLGIIKRSPITINYNFDDTVQRMLLKTRTAEERKRKLGYATVWNANIQMYPRDAVIYHPNGYLPHILRERPSEHLVFLEDSFADQLIDSMAGHYTALAYHLAQATRLLIGLSLSDGTLKHLLRQNALCHPGHYHYHVAYVADSSTRDVEFERTAYEANFEVYNLITLFLTAEEIAALGELLDMDEKDFTHLAEELDVPTTLRYQLTGSVAVGKTTTISQFRSFHVHDEWLEQRPEQMDRDPSLTAADKLAAIDKWVMEQLNLKNIAMLDSKPGIHIIDRAPLDAFAFTPVDAWKEKAQMIREAISPGSSKRQLVPAHIILLIGDPDVMASRAIIKHRTTEGKLLKQQQELLEVVYGFDRKGVTVVNTRDKSTRQVTKEVARIIHSQEYSEASLHEWLLQAESEGIIRG